MSTILALFSAPRADTPEATEFLRVLVALLAVGHDVRLVEAGRGVGVLEGDSALGEEGERYLDALREDSVVPRAARNLAAEVAEVDGVVRLGDPSRTGDPPFLSLPPREEGAPSAPSAILTAGQVVLHPHVPSR